MKTYVALFRAINVGGNNILPMKPLVSLLDSCGLKNIKTYIQTGNVVFQTDQPITVDIANEVETGFGFRPEVILLDEDAFALCVKNNPYSSKEGKLVHCYFCMAKAGLNNDKIEQLISGTEQCSLIGNVFYLHAPDGIGRSKLVKNIEACLGVKSTGRNLNTINKVLNLINSY